MELVNSLFSPFRNSREASSAPVQEGAPAPSKGGDFAQRTVNGRSKDVALSVAAYYRAVEVRANMMSMTKMMLQRKHSVGNNYVEDMGNQKDRTAMRINYLFQVQPNPYMTASRMFSLAEIQVMNFGNALIYIERGSDGSPIHLWLASGGTYNYANDTYTLTFPVYYGKPVITTSSRNVLHKRNTMPDADFFNGTSCLQHAAKALSLAATNEKQATENAAKGGRLKLILQEENKQMGLGKAAKGQLEKVRKQTEDNIYNQDVILLPNITGITPISMSAADMQLLEQRKFSVQDIARFTGVPTFLLMDNSNSSYKSASEARYDLMQSTLAPNIKDWENECEMKLLSFEDYGIRRFHLCASELLRLDLEGQAKIDALHLQAGWSLNEVRSQYDLPSLGTDGDKHFYSANLKCLEEPDTQPTIKEGGDT